MLVELDAARSIEGDWKTFLQFIRSTQSDEAIAASPMYNDWVERPSIDACKAKFQEDAEGLRRSCEPIEYLERVMQAVQPYETGIFASVLPTTRQRLEATVEAAFIEPHLDWVMEGWNVPRMLRSNDEIGLARLYSQLKAIKSHAGIKAIGKHLADCITEEWEAVEHIGGATSGSSKEASASGASQIAEEAPASGASQIAEEAPASGASQIAGRPLRRSPAHAQKLQDQALCLALVESRARHLSLVDRCFDSDGVLTRCVNECFKPVVNAAPPAGQSPVWMLLVDAVDALLMGTLHGPKRSDDEVMALLRQVLALCELVADKDLLRDRYHQQLATRLLRGKSVSKDAERLVLAAMKVANGVAYTMRLESTFNDYYAPASTGAGAPAEDDGDPASDTGGIELSCRVLCTARWPLKKSPVQDVRLPACMMRAVR